MKLHNATYIQFKIGERDTPFGKTKTIMAIRITDKNALVYKSFGSIGKKYCFEIFKCLKQGDMFTPNRMDVLGFDTEKECKDKIIELKKEHGMKFSKFIIRSDDFGILKTIKEKV